MLTITSKIQMDQCRKQLNELSFESMIISNDADKITRRLTSYEEDALTVAQRQAEAQGKKLDKDQFLKDLKSSDPTYTQLYAVSTAMETRQASIESEMKVLDDAMEAFEKEHQAGIKSDTTFWCFGG